MEYDYKITAKKAGISFLVALLSFLTMFLGGLQVDTKYALIVSAVVALIEAVRNFVKINYL